MKPDSVTVVDQLGGLLSKDGANNDGSEARIRFQRQVEDKYRQQLLQLLTPLVGAGNFTAEVQADVNLDETSATRESFDKDGRLRDNHGHQRADGEILVHKFLRVSGSCSQLRSKIDK